MSSISDIRDAIQELAVMSMSEVSNPNVIVGTVVAGSVDQTNRTCIVQPIDSQATIINNVMFSNENDVDPNQVPAEGAIVTVLLQNSSSGFIIQHGAIQGVNLAGSDHGGLVISAKMIDILNKITDYVNNFTTQIYNVHTHTVTIASLGTPTPSAPTTSLETTEINNGTPFTVSDVENAIVKHGANTPVPSKTAYNANLLVAEGILAQAQATVTGITNVLSGYQQGTVEFDQTSASLDRAKVQLAEAQANYDFLKQNPK
jgi:hypothetical protein